MDQEKIGKFIKSLREKEGISQQKFAQKYGVTYQAVSKWENGKSIPDISILKKICSDYDMNLDSFLQTKIPSSKKKKIILIFGFITIILLSVIIIMLLIFRPHNDNFEFKTLTSNCANFNLTGSIAYDKKKSSIFISHIDYCGGDDEQKYAQIECSLYENNNKTKTEITKCNYLVNKNVTLEKFLEGVTFKIDNYEQTCSKYQEDTLQLEIIATTKKGKTLSYKIPLKLEENCSS